MERIFVCHILFITVALLYDGQFELKIFSVRSILHVVIKNLEVT